MYFLKIMESYNANHVFESLESWDWKYFPLEIITFWTWQLTDTTEVLLILIFTKKNLSKTPQALGSQAHFVAMLLDQIATFAPQYHSGSHG